MLHGKLKQIIQSSSGEKQAHNLGNILNDLITITKDLKAVSIKFENPYANDKYRDYKGETTLGRN